MTESQYAEELPGEPVTGELVPGEPVLCEPVPGEPVTGEPVLCDSVWCTSVFDEREGFGGRCPACLAVADEHVASGHLVAIADCLECDRAGDPRMAVTSLGIARSRLRSRVA